MKINNDMERKEIESQLINLLNKREKHLCDFVEYLKSLAKNKSDIIFTDYCSECAELDKQEKELLKKLIELI